MWDVHMHCDFSGDSDTPAEEMIKSAIAKGLDGICFTDHEDIDYPETPNPFLLDFSAYHDAIADLKKRYKEKLTIFWGMEFGLQPHLTEELKHLVLKYPFDFVIGSSHIVHGRDPYYPSYFEGRSERDAYMEYFESALENIQAFDDYDVYGHIDYVVRYGPTRNENYSYNAYSDILDEILRALIAKGKGIEINTGGFKYGLGHPNPTEDVLKRYRSLGGEIITIGSDAHAPEHIAYDFDKATAILRACGFHYYTVFREREAFFSPLP